MIVYRICKLHPPDNNPIDGEGSAKYGGRWNSEGVKMVYTASSLALARSELARHMNLATIPDDYYVYEIEIPDKDCPVANPLPSNWKEDPEPQSTKQYGDYYFSDINNLCFKVPSVLDPKSFNYLLNPDSAHFKLVKVVNKYPFEP